MIIDKRDLVPGNHHLTQPKKDKPPISDGSSAMYSFSFSYSSPDSIASLQDQPPKSMCPMIPVGRHAE